MWIHRKRSPSKQGTISEPVGTFIIGTAPPVYVFVCIHMNTRVLLVVMSLTRVVLGQNWYDFTGTCHLVKNSWFPGKHVSTHQICSQNPVNSRTETCELSQLNSWIHLQNMWNHGSLFAGVLRVVLFRSFIPSSWLDKNHPWIYNQQTELGTGDWFIFF